MMLEGDQGPDLLKGFKQTGHMIRLWFAKISLNARQTGLFCPEQFQFIPVIQL